MMAGYGILRRRAASGRSFSASLRRRVLVPGFFILAPIVSAPAATLVGPGDVLRISVLEDPHLGREAPVDADGRIVLPHVGAVAVSGVDIDGARDRIEAAIVKRDLLRTPTITVEIASYRPFYVGGAVASPGAVPFSPGMTPRHAIILAGGIDRTNGPDRLSATDLLDLRAKWEGNAFALVQVESEIVRLRAEMDGLQAPDFSSVDTGTGAPEAAAIIELDAGQFSDRLKQSTSSRQHLQTGLELADLEIDVLEKQAILQREEEAIQADQVEKTRTLLARGLVPATRLQEMQREKSQISRDLLENQAFAARARQDKETVRYELEVAEAKRRIEIRSELAKAIGERAKLQAEEGVLASALLAAGIAIADPDAPDAPNPEVSIHRVVDGKETEVAATMNTAVEPGDVVQITISRKRRK